MMTRRDFVGRFPRALAGAGAGALSACSPGTEGDGYEAAVGRIWRLGPLRGLEGAALSRELVRHATLAPSSHNTQCWKFAIEATSITILPDLSRRCPAVDPDDHHLFVSLGCAAENLIQAASAFGLRGEARFDAARDAVDIALEPTAAPASPLFGAMARRQSTRAEYDGRPVATDALKLLETAAASDHVRVVMLFGKAALERVLEFVVQGNTAQIHDQAFVTELKSWIRFSDAEAVRLGDGLFARSSGNPAMPRWLGEWLFGLVFTLGAENDKCARHVRSSAGVAVFTGRQADKAHWVEVGRAYERFALQATALDIRCAHLNQPVEVAALRPRFARDLGLGAARPDLVLRFGHGPRLPASLRRPVQAVLV